ncbi:MAG: hypothetical protein ACREHD_18615 [Pirellulales bacterium]
MRLQTTVLPGHRIEFSSPDLADGDTVEVIVMSGATAPRRTMLELLQSLPNGPQLFATPQDADRYLLNERQSWER